MYEMTDFTNVKEGDNIAYRIGHWHQSNIVTTVVRVTPKQFEDNRRNTFRKADGKRIGESHIYAHYATSEEIAAFKEQSRRGFLCSNIIGSTGVSYKLEQFTTADLEAIYDIVKKYKEPKEE